MPLLVIEHYLRQEDLQRFIAVLDERLLDLCTGKDTAGLHLTIPEYEEWQRTGKLTHVGGARLVMDSFAAAYQDTIRVPHEVNFEIYDHLRELFGIHKTWGIELPQGAC